MTGREPSDVGDGWAARCRAAEDYAVLLMRERDEARAAAGRYLRLLRLSVDRTVELLTELQACHDHPEREHPR